MVLTDHPFHFTSVTDFIQVPPNSSGEKVAVQQLSDGLGNLVDRQEIIVTDATTYSARVKVQSSEPSQSDYGLTVRRVESPSFYYHKVSQGLGDAAVISSIPSRITGWSIFNNANYPIFVKFHNQTSTPTPGVGVVYTVGVQSGLDGPCYSSDDGIDFITGLGITIVKGILDSDATAVVASDCVINIHYKAL